MKRDLTLKKSVFFDLKRTSFILQYRTIHLHSELSIKIRKVTSVKLFYLGFF